MALVDVVEVLVHAEELTNLELLRKGLYRVGVRVHAGSEPHATEGFPFACVCTPSRLTSLSRGVSCAESEQAYEAAYIDEATGTYYTRSAYLRYVDESFSLSESVQFRLELPCILDDARPSQSRYSASAAAAASREDARDIHVTFTLMRADVEARPTPAGGEASEMQRKGEWVKVSSRAVSLTAAQSGRAPPRDASVPLQYNRHIYAPVVFDTVNLCVAGVSVHSSLISTRYAHAPSPLESVCARVDAYKAAVRSWRERERRRMEEAAAASAAAAAAVASGSESAREGSSTHEDAASDRTRSSSVTVADSQVQLVDRSTSPSRAEVSNSLVRWASGAADAMTAVARGSRHRDAVRPKGAVSRWFNWGANGAASPAAPAVPEATHPEAPPIPPVFSSTEEAALRRPHSFAEALFDDWRERRAAARLAVMSSVVKAAGTSTSSPMRSTRGGATPEAAPTRSSMDEVVAPPSFETVYTAVAPFMIDAAQLDALHRKLLDRLRSTMQALTEFRIVCTDGCDALSRSSLMQSLNARALAHNAMEGHVSRFRLPVRLCAARHLYHGLLPRWHAGNHTPGMPGTVYDERGRALPEDSNTFMRGHGSFSERAAACVSDPEAIALALQHEIETTAAVSYDAWRHLLRLLMESSFDVHLPLQALYRTACLRSVRDIVAGVWQTPEQLYDVLAPAPASASGPKRLSVMMALEHVPHVCQPLLDAALARVRQTLDVRVLRYSAGVEPSRAAMGVHEFSDSEQDDDAELDGSVKWHSAREALETASVVAAPAESASAAGAARLAASRTRNSGKSSGDIDHETVRRSGGDDAEAAAAAIRDARSSDVDRMSFLSEGGPSPMPTPAMLHSTNGVHGMGRHSSILSELARLQHTPAAAPSRKAHIVIFLNGLGGSTHDTRVLRSYLKMHHPLVYCFVTTSNQGKATDDDIVQISTRVANEIHACLTVEVPGDGWEVGRISFVAFSLGGIVLRLALRHPLLQPFWPQLHAFVSVASPHMGLLYSQSSLVSAGLFLFQKWRKSTSLAQLSFADEPTNGPESIRNCMLYLLACGWESRRGGLASMQRIPSFVVNDSAAAFTPVKSEARSGLRSMFAPRESAQDSLAAMERDPALAESVRVDEAPGTAPGATNLTATLDRMLPLPAPGAHALDALQRGGFASEPNGYIMKNFEHIVLLSSSQDSYAPQWSCSVQLCDAAVADARHGGAYGEMLRGFFDGVPLQNISRWDIKFKHLSSIFQGKLSVDSVIGREAHVAFLETEELAALVAVALASVWDTALA